MSPWGEGWAGALTYLALASWRWCYAATLQHVVLELASCHHGVRGGALTYLALASWRWCYATARCLGTCVNLRHVTMGWGVGGCVNVPGTCLLKMMLRRYATARCLGTCVNLRHVTMGWGVGGCVNVPGTCALKMMLRRYATARCPGTCVMSPWGEGWAGALTYLALASWRWCYAATLQHVVLELASICVMSPWGEGWAGALTYPALAPWRWCYAAMLQHAVLELASWHHGVRGGRVR